MINDSNYKQLLKIGIINNNDMIEMFGNDNNKRTFQKSNKLGSMKNTLINRANRYCCINDLKNGKYKIEKIYNIPIPININRLINGIYKYMSPLILLKVKEEHDENNKILLPYNNLANNISMINNNYKTIKYNKTSMAEESNINIDIISDFYQKTDDNIKYYLHTCLTYLKSADVLEFFEIPMVKVRKLQRINKNDKNINLEGYYEYRRATEEEIKFIIESQEYIRKKLNIKTKSECYYSKKAQRFNDELSKRLSQRDILRYYNAYEIYYTNIERLNNLLSYFNYKNKKELIKQFNKEFINIIMTNAGKRFIELARNLDANYLSGFLVLSNTTIPYNAKQINVNKVDENDKDFIINIETRSKDNESK